MNDVYEVVKVPAPVLKQQAGVIGTVDSAIEKQLTKMRETMYASKGVGLAANQVGILNRALVMDVTQQDETRGQAIYMVNPEIIWESEERSTYQEGCLSIPQQYADIERPASVRVKYLDEKGAAQELLTNAEENLLLNHCVQHEIDHLNGRLFIDYLSSIRRNMMVKKVQKIIKQDQHVL
jgi:peptide deformylase